VAYRKDESGTAAAESPMKIEITLDHSEVKAAISASLTAHGYTVPADASFVIDPQGNVTVTVLPSVVAPPPTTSPDVDPGPPFSLKCIATCFGFEDPGDNGVGAFIDPATEKPYNTANKTLIGASVPIPIVMATLGANAKEVASKYRVKVQANGRIAEAELVDLGPGESLNGQHALLEGKDGLHALDMTYGLCEALGLKYDANSGSWPVTWWLEYAGKPVAMKGLDAPRKTI
jgi:hypothetical protein